MRTRPCVPLAIALLALAACDSHTPPPPPSGGAPDTAAREARAPAPTVAHARQVEIPRPEGEQPTPMAIPAGGAVEAQVATALAGELVGISVMVGNHADTSSGALALEACVDARCAQGSADVSLSNDNAMFDIALGTPLPLQAGDVVRYRLQRPEGANDIALWTYSTRSPDDRLASDAGRTPMVRLLLR